MRNLLHQQKKQLPPARPATKSMFVPTQAAGEGDVTNAIKRDNRVCLQGDPLTRVLVVDAAGTLLVLASAVRGIGLNATGQPHGWTHICLKSGWRPWIAKNGDTPSLLLGSMLCIHAKAIQESPKIGVHVRISSHRRSGHCPQGSDSPFSRTILLRSAS